LNGGLFRNFRKVAVVESSTRLPQSLRNVSDVNDVCQIITEDAEQILLEVKTDSPAILVFADQHYPGWEAYVSSKADVFVPARILRVNRVMRGIYLEAGDYEVEFRYRPSSVYWGLRTSVLAWTLLLLAMISFRKRA